MSFLTWLQIGSAITVCALVGGTLGCLVLGFAGAIVAPKKEHDGFVGFACVLGAAIGFFGGIWLYIAWFI